MTEEITIEEKLSQENEDQCFLMLDHDRARELWEEYRKDLDYIKPYVHEGRWDVYDTLYWMHKQKEHSNPDYQNPDIEELW